MFGFKIHRMMIYRARRIIIGKRCLYGHLNSTPKTKNCLAWVRRKSQRIKYKFF